MKPDSSQMFVGILCAATAAFTGCCPNDPFAALAAGNLLQERTRGAETEADQTFAVAQAISAMTPCELASLVNIMARTDWTEGDALSVQNAFSQVDALKAQQLTLLITDADPTPEEIRQGFLTVAILITIETAELIKEMLDGFRPYQQPPGDDNGGFLILPPILPPLFP
ncbi:MAG TPA: hypothetical protein VNT79_10410 [Phycisphaerae bacterium]|nr:hypothetical protein [Phycisphaerae bacterium]